MRFLIKFKDGNRMIMPAKMFFHDKLGTISASSFDVTNPFTGVYTRVFLNNFHNKKKTVLYEE